MKVRVKRAVFTEYVIDGSDDAYEGMSKEEIIEFEKEIDTTIFLGDLAELTSNISNVEECSIVEVSFED